MNFKDLVEMVRECKKSGEKISSPSNERYTEQIGLVEQKISKIKSRQIKAYREAENVYFK